MKEDQRTAVDDAARLLWPEPPQWLPGHFERTLHIARNFYASGVGRIPRARIKKEIENFKKLVDEFEASLSGWGALFSEGEGGARAVDAVRATLPALKEAVTNAGGKVTTKSGPGAASMVDDWLYPKDNFGAWRLACG